MCRSRAAKWATRMAQMCRSQAIKWAMRSRHRKIAAEARASPAGRRREPAGRICERSAGSASLHVLLMVTARTTTPPIPLPKSSSTASRLYLFANSGFLASPMYVCMYSGPLHSPLVPAMYCPYKPQWKQQQQEGQPGRRETLLFILLIEFNFVLITFLKDARERGAHDDCQSPLPA